MTYDQFIADILSTRGRVLEKADKERHHILPRCMGGSDDAENLVDLELEEHFIAHKLLAEENPGNMKLQYAFRRMSNIRRVGHTTLIETPEQYREARLENKHKTVETNFGKELREETKRKISEANKGKKRSPEVGEAISERLKEYYKTHPNPMQGRKLSDEAKAKMSEAHKHRDPESYKHKLTEEQMAQKVAKFKETYWSKPEEVRKEQTRKQVANREPVKYWEGKEIPQETRDKISATLKEKHLAPPHSIRVYCKETDTTYRSLTEAQNTLGIDRHIIRQYAEGKRTDERYHFTFIQ